MASAPAAHRLSRFLRIEPPPVDPNDHPGLAPDGTDPDRGGCATKERRSCAALQLLQPAESPVLLVMTIANTCDPSQAGA
jgi:hypothetical protein